MRKYTLLFLLLLSNASFAQWRKIANFQWLEPPLAPTNAYTSCVYFLDLPGPPRVGFCGSKTDLWKTIDGGKKWNHVWGDTQNHGGYNLSSVFFKDSLMGWFAISDSWEGSQQNSGCYRTTNGGNTWIQLTVPHTAYGCSSVYYDTVTDRLFLTVDWSQYGDTSGLRVSTDLGDSWQQVSLYQSHAIYFSSSQNGIVTTAFTTSDYTSQTITGFLITTNGGSSWDTIHGYPADAENILPIPGTSILFAANGGQILISRSDDYGRTWRVLKDFGPDIDEGGVEIGPWSPGYIEGDLSRLYVQSDSGMFVSTDEGITWKNDGGPVDIGTDCSADFYAARGVAIVGATTTGADPLFEGNGLWEEIWPQSGVPEPEPSSDSLTVYPNPATGTVTISGAAKEATIYDPLGRERFLPRSENTIDISSLTSGIYYLRIQTANNETRTLKLVKQ